MPTTRSGRFGRVTPLDALWTTTEQSDTPLLVCLHGGALDARYFDAPNCSFIGRASEAGFPAVSLGRPGYPADDDSARRQPSYSGAAMIIAEAVADMWEQLGADRPGIVLVGQSMGAAVAVHLAATDVAWPLIGLAISGVAETLSPSAAELLQHLPSDIAITMPSEVLRSLFFGPEWTLDPTRLTDFADLTVSMPSSDGVELNTSWSADLPEVAARIDVPVHYTLAEFDQLWVTSPRDVEAFARHFSAAPFVEAAWWRCVGHNIEHHRLGEAYCRSVLAFAERCAMETRRPGAPLHD